MGQHKLVTGLVVAVAAVLQLGMAEPPPAPPATPPPATPTPMAPTAVPYVPPPAPPATPRPMPTRLVDQTLGEVIYFAGDFAPVGWAACRGDVVNVAQHPPLYSLLGTTFGSTTSADGKVVGFKLPDLRSGGESPLPIICVDGICPRPNEEAYTVDMVGAISLMPDAGVALPINMVPCRGQLLAADDELYQGPFATFGTAFGPPAGDGTTFQMPTLAAPAPGLQWAMAATGSLTPAMPVGSHFLGEIRRWPASAPLPRGWSPCDGTTLRIALNQALFSIMGTRFGGDGTTTFKLPSLPVEAGVRYTVCVVGQYPTQY